jgi:DNA-binding MarR family transcriptional regulator
VEGETLKIRQPLDPAFSRFRSELAQEDKFTLLVIQEHGSLTADELAEVLCEKRDHSSSRLERLSALGLIEPDPDHPGLRVHPEAQRFVNDLLRRTNLT